MFKYSTADYNRFNKGFKNYQQTKVRNKGCNPRIGDIHLNKRECERRMRQIKKGQLKLENGLNISFIPQYIFNK